ncbi:hypothetical protein Ancab_015219 [Ancistrocladus abbreviatus]
MAVGRKSRAKRGGYSMGDGHVASPARGLEATLMEDTTEIVARSEREDKAAVEEREGLIQRVKPTQLYMQEDLDEAVSKGASTAVGLDELGPNTLSPQTDRRRKKAACSPGPRKPKCDGARRSSLKMPKKCKPAQLRLPIPPDVNNDDKLLEHDVPKAEAGELPEGGCPGDVSRVMSQPGCSSPARAIVSSSSSFNIPMTCFTPYSPLAANPNITGLPTCGSIEQGGDGRFGFGGRVRWEIPLPSPSLFSNSDCKSHLKMKAKFEYKKKEQKESSVAVEKTKEDEDAVKV